ncbi:MAG: hypothetical protein GX139_07880 [Armatimonadetes bacterium]|jgi:hypothetical protein|nr:hypothetical protein [Armatimonadota bacterium]
MSADNELRQKFIVTVEWSPESGARLTEGDIHEEIEQLALEIDEDAVIEVSETLDFSD